MKKFNEIEQLSAYLDGQLNESDSKRLKTRLESDRELDSVLTDLSFARRLLRSLPKRKAPKNFTLTRHMVGLKPPLPKTYPLFRLATVFATLLFVLSFSVNALSPYVTFTAPQFGFGFGGGAGAPVAAEEPMLESMEAATEAPADVAPQSTETARVIEETPAPKNGESEDSSQDTLEEQNQPQVTTEAVFSSNVVWAFLFISIIGGIIMFAIRQNARRRWQ